MAQQPLMGQGFLIVEDSRSHSDTPHTVGALRMSDQPDAETSIDSTQHSHETDIHAPGGVRTHNPSKRAPADLAATGIGILLKLVKWNDISVA